MLAPVTDELAADYEGKAAIVKANVDDAPEYTIHYQIRSTPTILFFRNGQEIDRIVGAGKKPT